MKNNLVLLSLLFSFVTQANLNFIGKIINQIDSPSINKLYRADFSGATLNNITFKSKNLIKANFKNAVLNNCTFEACNLDEANFSNASLKLVKFRGVGSGMTSINTIFDGALIHNCTGLVDLLDSNQTFATGASFRRAKFIDDYDLPNTKSFFSIKFMDNYDFAGASFAGGKMDFSRAFFGPNVNFANTQFNGADVDFKMEAVYVMPSGSYDITREGLLFFETQIVGTNFSEAVFNNINFSYLKIKSANFRKAVFNNCRLLLSFISGDWSCTKFIDGVIKVNDFTGSKIAGSDLRNWTEHDADGTYSSNVFSPGHTYDKPASLERFECV